MDDAHLERIRAQFGRTAEIYARLSQTTDERSLRGLVRLSGAGADDHVLDVACGPGFLTMAFARAAAQVTGFDATDEFLELARERVRQEGLENVRFAHGDAAALPYEDGSFDVVSCRAAFHHFPEPAAILGEMVRVVRPGGRVLIADLLGSEDGQQAELHDRIEQLCDPTHVRALPASELARLFGEAGLEVTRDVRGTMDYELQEWISHGAPEPEARAEIEALMRSCVSDDRAGLRVRLEQDKLCFSHQTAAFLLTRP